MSRKTTTAAATAAANVTVTAADRDRFIRNATNIMADPMTDRATAIADVRRALTGFPSELVSEIITAAAANADRIVADRQRAAANAEHDRNATRPAVAAGEDVLDYVFGGDNPHKRAHSSLKTWLSENGPAGTSDSWRKRITAAARRYNGAKGADKAVKTSDDLASVCAAAMDDLADRWDEYVASVMAPAERVRDLMHTLASSVNNPQAANATVSTVAEVKTSVRQVLASSFGITESTADMMAAAAAAVKAKRAAATAGK